MALLLRAITFLTDAERASSGPLVAHAGIAAWVAEVEEASGFTREDMLAHHAAVTEIFERAEACLPARFPTLFGDADALQKQLAASADDLVRQLEHVRGRAEIGVTAVWTTPEEPLETNAAPPGTRYLLQRAVSWRRRALAADIADTLEHEVAMHIIDVRRHLLPRPEVAASLALLVERSAVAEVSGRLRRSRADVRILVHGPWPPYTFAGGRAELADGRGTGAAATRASTRSGGATDSY